VTSVNCTENEIKKTGIINRRRKTQDMAGGRTAPGEALILRRQWRRRRRRKKKKEKEENKKEEV
jgi:hypothetical protein